MYAELVCRSNYSFLTGASHPEELVARAHALGMEAIALTDDDGLYGTVKAHLAAKEKGLRMIIGARLTLEAPLGGQVVLCVESAAGYANLCELLTTSRLRHPKGEAGVPLGEIADRAEGLQLLIPKIPHSAQSLAPLCEAFPGRVSVGIARTLEAKDTHRFQRARAFAEKHRFPLFAHNDVHTHQRDRQPLQDVLTAIRRGTTVDRAGTLLFSNAERTLKGPAEMLALFSDLPEALERTMQVASACRFSLDDLRYEFSREALPQGSTPQTYLASLVHNGLGRRYPVGIPPEVTQQIERELRLIEELGYAGYFLSMWDLVAFARRRGILCQGRGSAANSAVCYALEITSIDPVRMGLLFERFLSKDRNEPPDIDVDFEHQRREEVIQYVYAKHGRSHAAMVSEHVCFRSRLAVREVGKALGLSLDTLDRLAKHVDFNEEASTETALRAGLSIADPTVVKVLALARQLSGMPRHLSIHVGGFVISDNRVSSIVPIENGSMKHRTVVQWDKDDLSAVNILKVDLLGLGMLTVLSRTFRLIEKTTGQKFSMATVPPEDSAVYDMLCEGDAIGVFQVESRAQLSMLPRLRPRSFYDLVIEVAIIRPGPIVGQMVHPYLRRRSGEEPVVFPSEAVREILGRTLGVPLFQEQAMRLAMVAAGFSAGEADRLRRALSHKRADQLLPTFRERFVGGAIARGYHRDFAEGCFDSFKGFSHYGFPESHAASFALIVYVSAWLKRYYPAAFCAALLDAQPMGFYAVHTLVEDARRHGVEVRPVSADASGWESRLEIDGTSLEAYSSHPSEGHPVRQPALRLGFELVRGLQESSVRKIEEARRSGPFRTVGELAQRTRISRADLTRLALSGALPCPDRRTALWDIHALGPLDPHDLFFGLPMAEDRSELPQMSRLERVTLDYDATQLSLEAHPVALIRPALQRGKAVTAEALLAMADGTPARMGGLVIVRQRPPTARGFTFLSVEDETGIANFVIEPKHFLQFRQEITMSPLLLGEGRIERRSKVVNLKIQRLSAIALSEQAS